MKLTEKKRGWDQGREKERDDGRDEKVTEVEEGDETRWRRRQKGTEVSMRSFKQRINHLDSISVSLPVAHTQCHPTEAVYYRQYNDTRLSP